MEHARILPPPMLDTLAVQGLRELCFAPIPKVARALSGFNREQLGTAIEVMIAMLDAADPEPDLESGGDDEPNGDDLGDQAYVEWNTTPGNLRRNGQPCILAGHEDDEEDDQDACLAADDIGTAATPWHSRDGLPGDPGDAEDGHDREVDNDGY